MIKADLVKNLAKIVRRNLEMPDLEAADFLIIYDLHTPIAERLFEAYKDLLPAAICLDYYAMQREEVITAVDKCKKDDLVILIESSSFRMSNFRWRLELFNRGLRVIEHAHLGNNLPEQTETYLETLRDDSEYLERVGNILAEKLSNANEVKIISDGGAQLIYSGPFEEVKKNLGNFSGKATKGCGFPIGEVFTEPVNLEAVNGVVEIFAFADTEHRVIFPEQPVLLKIMNGQVEAGSNSPEKFNQVIELLKSENSDGVVWARELGLGLNRGISRTVRLDDISAYERLCGVHMSLGLKHDIYRGKMGKSKAEHYHIDIFPAVSEVWLDGEKVFENGAWTV